MPAKVKLAMPGKTSREVFQKRFFSSASTRGRLYESWNLHLLGPLSDLCPTYDGDVKLSL